MHGHVSSFQPLLLRVLAYRWTPLLATLFLAAVLFVSRCGPSAAELHSAALAASAKATEAQAAAAAAAAGASAQNARPCSSAAAMMIAAQYGLVTTAGHPGHPNDITDHIPLIYAAARGAARTTELGVRGGVASWAFAEAAAERAAAGLPVAYRAVDVIKLPSIAALDAAMAGCPGVDYAFLEGNDLVVGPWPSDVLLLDTWHVYKQLIVELPRWAPHTASTIILHDTTTYGAVDEEVRNMPIDFTLFAKTQKSGLWTAVQDFLASPQGANWRIKERRHTSNGLTVLERVKPE